MTTPVMFLRSLHRARRHAVRVAMSATALLALAACGTRDASEPFAPTGAFGRVRFVNLITDAPRATVNARLRGQVWWSGITYGQCVPCILPAPSTAPYSAAYEGNATLLLQRTADTLSTVLTFDLPVVRDADHTVYATGGAGGTAVGTLVTRDTNPVPAAGQARVRVVHLAPVAGAVDVFVTAPGADLAAATPTLANVAVRSVSGYLAIAGGTYQLRAVPAGTAPAARAGAVALNVASLAIPAGANRTIIAAENAGGGAPLRAVVLTDR